MKTEPRDVLRDLLRKYGADLETNPQRVRALLSDLCPECRKEINLIIQAQQQIEIPRRLKAQTAHLPVAVVLPALSRLMEDHYGTSPEPARWAVETWAVALGMALPVVQPSPPPPSVIPQPTRAPLTPRPVAPPTNPAAAIASSTFWTPPYGEPVWVEIPAGEFWMGGEQHSHEKPVHKVHLERYWMAKTPVTNAQYRLFVEATGRKAPRHWENGKIPRGLESHPVTNVTWHDALAYCNWLGEMTGKFITLPSEAEWEKAARGDRDKREYPWGMEWKGHHCNSGELGVGDTTPVGIFPEGASPYGCLDMAGNAQEWTRSLWGGWDGRDYTSTGEPFRYPYKKSDGRENIKADEKWLRVLRGGTFKDTMDCVRCASRVRLDPFDGYGCNGFRVCVVSRQE